MPSQPLASRTTGPRQRLIDAAVEYGAEHGLADTSLRQLAAALGTSHRMLIHHFGSKEGLLVEVVRVVEQRQREVLADLTTDTGDRVEQLNRRFWDSLNDPSVRAHERLFFEVYGQALQGKPWAVPLLEGIVDDWIEPLVRYLMSNGLPEATARVDARLAIAVSRGLLLDVLATGEQEAVDAALERFGELLTSWIRQRA
jgi:AcrR family transcriptional regulator